MRQAIRVAGAQGAKPDADELSRTLESLSLAATLPEHPGRLTEPVRPGGLRSARRRCRHLSWASGFGRLPGLGKAPAETAGAQTSRAAGKSEGGAAPQESEAARRARKRSARVPKPPPTREREKEFAAQKRKAEAALDAAEQDFERSKTAEAKAREALEDAERAREDAHARLVAARKFLTSNF